MSSEVGVWLGFFGGFMAEATADYSQGTLCVRAAE